MSRGLVSVIMPTYNRADFIREAIKSVLNQTYQHLELIIIDDGSTDLTSAIINNLQSPVIRYFPLEHSGNISKLRNFGVQKAKGEFIAYLDADDYWDVNKLTAQLQLLATDSSTGLIFTDAIEFNENGIIKNGILKAHVNKISFKDILDNNLPIYPSSILYRKDGLAKTAWHDESFRWNDLGFITRYIACNGGMACNQKLTYIRKHKQNISSVRRADVVGFRDMLNTTEVLYHQNFLTKKEFKDITKQFRLGMASTLTGCGEYQAALETYKKLLSENPLSLRTIGHLLRLKMKLINR